MPATRPPSCRIVSGPSGISPFRLSRTSSVMTVKIRRVAGSQRLSMAFTSAITIAVAVLTRSASATGTTVVASVAGAHASATTAARIHEPRRLHTMAAHIGGKDHSRGGTPRERRFCAVDYREEPDVGSGGCSALQSIRLRHALELLQRDRAVQHLARAVLEERARALAASAGAQVGFTAAVVDQDAQILGDRHHLEDGRATDDARAVAGRASLGAIERERRRVGVEQHARGGVRLVSHLAVRTESPDEALGQHGGPLRGDEVAGDLHSRGAAYWADR